MGGTAGRIATGVATGGLSEAGRAVYNNPTLKRGATAGLTGGLSEFIRHDPFGVPINNPLYGIFGNKNKESSGVSGPFALDPAQVAADQEAITGLGKSQYADTLSSIDENSAAQQEYAAQTLQRMIPLIGEDANARKVFESSAYPQEVAKQASYLSQDVASQRSNAIANALQGRQGFETGALQRGLSLEDFINQSNVAKTIGAQMAPPPPTGKQNFGTVAQGVGALAPWGRVALGARAATGGAGK